MYFPDLSLCIYSNEPANPAAWNVPLLAIGWLDSGNNFSTGDIDEKTIEKARQFREETRRQFSGFNYRGLHGCTLCESGEAMRSIEGSQTNLYIPGIRCIYIASGGLVHYMEKHSYLPPKEFRTALLACPPPISRDYEEALVTTNLGERPSFLWTREERLTKRKTKQWSRRNIEAKRILDKKRIDDCLTILAECGTGEIVMNELESLAATEPLPTTEMVKRLITVGCDQLVEQSYSPDYWQTLTPVATGNQTQIIWQIKLKHRKFLRTNNPQNKKDTTP